MFPFSEQYFIYWVLRVALFLSFVITGCWISKRHTPSRLYWQDVIPLMVLYSLVEGLRWNRGQDYYNYYLEICGSLEHDSMEFVYSSWLSFVQNVGIPYWMVFIFYSFVLVFSFINLLKRFPQTAFYALPLFFIITATQSENLIRQFFSLSFVILAISAYFDKRYLLMIFLLVISEGIHFSAVFPIIMMAISILLAIKYKPSKPFIPAIIFLILYFFWDYSFFTSISEPILALFPETGTKMDGYVQSDTWFAAEGSMSLASTGNPYAGRHITTAIIQLPLYFFIVVGGFYASKRKWELRFFYWCAYFALLLDIARGDIQSYIRLYHWMAFFISIVVGIIYTELHLNKIVKFISISLLIVYYLWGMMFTNMRILDPWGYAFIWDR